MSFPGPLPCRTAPARAKGARRMADPEQIKKAVAIDGGKRVRKRAIRKVAITKRQERKFFAVLAQSCNVAMAAREAGIRPQRVYEKRKADAAFREAWGEAIAAGYEKLELVLLERALVGTEKITVDKSGGETRVREYPNNIALSLLKLHREDAREAQARKAQEMGPEEVQEVRERIIEKLERLAEKYERQDREKGGEA